MKKLQITFQGESPMQIIDDVELIDDVEQVSSEINDEQRETVRQTASTIKAYLTAIEELIEEKYAHIKDLIPVHLANPGNVLVASCPDGVVVRYERKTDNLHIFGIWFSEELPYVVSLLSQNAINCYPDRNYTSVIPATGTELTLSKENPTTNKKEDIISVKIGFDVVVERPEHLPPSPQKPFCLVSAQNSFEFHMLGELMQEDKKLGEGQSFLARSRFRLPVGWECIEVYPFIDLEQWKSEYVSLWAENDLLASVVTHQFREAHFQSLDPNATARRQFTELLQSYKNLLDSNPEREEILQSFLRDNPVLLCPTHIKLWPKLPLGNRTTDFVFQEATGDYLLVEIERSTYRLFLKDGHTSRELNHALGQVMDWKRYLEDNLSTVQREVGLIGVSTNPESLVVIGRSESLTPENRRKLTTIRNEMPKTKIMTYDDVYENAKAMIENLFGPIWEHSGNTQIYYLPKQ